MSKIASTKWQKVVGVGCSHGHLANTKACEAVLKFMDSFKPDHRIHLGDAYDLTAFRSGAKGTKDEGQEVDCDLSQGRQFLRDFRPTVLCMGNHENRAVNLAEHHNTIVKTAAKDVLKRMLEPAKASKAIIIPYTFHQEGWYELGGYRWGHGHLFAENYLRDTAEAVGNCVVAHAHRPGMATGRRMDNPTCYGVGCLMDIKQAGYASGRRSTFAWGNAFIYGYVRGNQAQLNLWAWPNDTQEYLLPM